MINPENKNIISYIKTNTLNPKYVTLNFNDNNGPEYIIIYGIEMTDAKKCIIQITNMLSDSTPIPLGQKSFDIEFEKSVDTGYTINICAKHGHFGKVQHYCYTYNFDKWIKIE